MDNSNLTDVSEQEFSSLTSHVQEVNLNDIEIDEPEVQVKEKQAVKTGDKPSSEISLGSVLPSESVVRLIDVPMSILIVLAYRIGGFDVSKNDTKLNATERTALTQPMQNLLDYIKIDLKNPVNAFIFAMVLIYGAKSAEVADKATKRKAKDKDGSNQPFRKRAATKQAKEDPVIDFATETNDTWKEKYSDLTDQYIIQEYMRKKSCSSDVAIDLLIKKGQISK